MVLEANSYIIVTLQYTKISHHNTAALPTSSSQVSSVPRSGEGRGGHETKCSAKLPPTSCLPATFSFTFHCWVRNLRPHIAGYNRLPPNDSFWSYFTLFICPPHSVEQPTVSSSFSEVLGLLILHSNSSHCTVILLSILHSDLLASNCSVVMCPSKTTHEFLISSSHWSTVLVLLTLEVLFTFFLSSSVILFILLVGIVGVISDFFVVLFQSRQVLPGFCELAFFHAFTHVPAG